jgi:phospholipid-binding lipoprotein MlaA
MKIFKNFTILLFSLVLHTNIYAEYTKSNDMQSDEYPSYDLNDEACSEIQDPYEGFNRKVFVFNSFLDYVLLKPVAKSYRILVPDFAKDKVGNFVDNLTEPVTIVNNVLQFRLRDTVAGIWRFFINTTVGVGGLFDIASKMGIQTEPQTFGSTLARYGVQPGPYLVVPFFGSTNGRDISDIFVLSKIDPVKYNMNKYQRNGYTALSMVHNRSVMLPITDSIAAESADPYASIRSLVHQRREHSLRYPAKTKSKCKKAR